MRWCGDAISYYVKTADINRGCLGSLGLLVDPSYMGLLLVSLNLTHISGPLPHVFSSVFSMLSHSLDFHLDPLLPHFSGLRKAFPEHCYLPLKSFVSSFFIIPITLVYHFLLSGWLPCPAVTSRQAGSGLPGSLLHPTGWTEFQAQSRCWTHTCWVMYVYLHSISIGWLFLSSIS